MSLSPAKALRADDRERLGVMARVVCAWLSKLYIIRHTTIPPSQCDLVCALLTDALDRRNYHRDRSISIPYLRAYKSGEVVYVDCTPCFASAPLNPTPSAPKGIVRCLSEVVGTSTA